MLKLLNKKTAYDKKNDVKIELIDLYNLYYNEKNNIYKIHMEPGKNNKKYGYIVYLPKNLKNFETIKKNIKYAFKLFDIWVKINEV